ncbi:hypothetical protein [Aureivirga marina]|uniref:hypothetical protein n=1 Tax=Aureivirga marina TaxID=1182451 RepID=UPI0018CA9E6A|nr:hypothetical protein [Aureivirga marina]
MTTLNIKYFTLFFTLITLEIIASELAFETLGSINRGIYYGLISLNSIPFILFLKKKKAFSIILFLVIGLIMIPKQLYLGIKLIALKEEGANIVEFIYQHKKSKGYFPNDITTYTFENPNLSQHFHYDKKTNQDDFSVLYYVGSKNTSHFYRHSDGNSWSYYPD